MRSLFLKGILTALFAAALAPVAHAQREVKLKVHEIPLGGLSALADGFVYDNTTFYQPMNAAGDPFFYLPGGAGPEPGNTGNTITRMVMDDMTFLPGYAGVTMNTFFASVYNGNTTNINARLRVRFWLADGANGGPGTYFNETLDGTNVFYTFTYDNDPANNPPITPGYHLFYTNLPTTGAVPKVPTNGKMWVGMSFDNSVNTAGYATTAQLNNLGVVLFDPPAAGSSADQMFLTTTPGQFREVNAPAGALFDLGHATDATKPVASFFFGWTVTGFSLFGQLTIEGVADAGTPPKDVFLTFTPVGGGTPFTVFVQTTLEGAYQADVPPGDYNVQIKTPKTLSKTIHADLRTGNVTGANVTLKTGDANDDNAVDISDLLLLIGHYNNNPDYLDAADFNEDGANDITDLLLIVQNYNQQGA